MHLLAQLSFMNILFQFIEMVFYHFNLINGHCCICFFEAKKGLTSARILLNFDSFEKEKMYLIMEN